MTDRWRINEMTDEELVRLYEDTIRGVADGSISTFGDYESLAADLDARFPGWRR